MNYKLTEKDLRRFWVKVDRRGPDECWLWLAYIDHWGYGMFGLNGRTPGSHRIAYEICRNEAIPPGLQIDHLCRVRSCVNPKHLEIVTNRTNTIRGLAAEVNAARMRAITHCPRGHTYDEANTYYARNGSRACRACHRMWAHERHLRKKAAVA